MKTILLTHVDLDGGISWFVLDCFIWVMKRKGSQYIEKIMDIVLEKLKG